MLTLKVMQTEFESSSHCQNCKEKTTKRTDNTGETVCTTCGMVCPSETIYDLQRPEYTLGSKIAKSQDRIVRKFRNIQQYTKSYEERNLDQMLTIFNQMTWQTGSKEDFGDIYRKIYSGIKRGVLKQPKLIVELVLIIIFILSKKCGQKVSLRRVMKSYSKEFSKIKTKNFGRIVKYANKIILSGIINSQPFCEPSDLQSYAEELSKRLRLNREIIIKLKDVITSLKEHHAHIGKNPMALVAGIIYLVSRQNGKRILQATIAKAAKINVNTIRTNTAFLLTQPEFR